MGRSCDYCPSEAINYAWDRYVCSLHQEAAKRDYDEAESRGGSQPKIAAGPAETLQRNFEKQYGNAEGEDEQEYEEDDGELDANIPDIDVDEKNRQVAEIGAGIVEAIIRKENGKYCVRSPNNPKWNGGCYDSKGAAEKRLKQVEFFKHKGGTFMWEGSLYAADTAGVWQYNVRKAAWLPYHLWSVEADVTGIHRSRTRSDHPKRSSGILFICQGRVLLVRRAHDEKHPNVWSIPGGHLKLARDGMPRDPWGNALREVREEMGSLPPGTGRATKKHRAITKRGKTYVTYIVELPPGAMKWRPQLNPEHAAYRWCNPKQVKALKLHPNLRNVLKNSQVWEGKFYTTVNIVMERDASIGDVIKEQTDQVNLVNAAAKEVFGSLAKDMRFVRMELTTVMHGPPGYVPVAGVDGVMRNGSDELYFTLSVSPRNGKYRVLLTTKKVGYKVAATFRTSAGIPKWVIKKLNSLDLG